MRSLPEAGSTDQDWGEKRAQNMVTVDNDGAKQAVLRSVDEIFNVRRATRKISHPSHSLYETLHSSLAVTYSRVRHTRVGRTLEYATPVQEVL